MTRQQMIERLAELEEKIRDAPQWGALLTALSEERKALEANLKGSKD